MSVPRDFRFEHSLTYLRRSPLELLHRCLPDGVRKAGWLNGRLLVFEVRSPGKAAGAGLAVRCLNAPRSPGLREALEVYIRGWFDLDRDLRDFLKIARKDAILGQIVNHYRGYRMVSVPDLFECLVWAVIGQQINLAFAYRLKARFVESFGDSVEVGGERYHVFPQPGTVARIRPERLRRLQFSRQKIEYTRNIARAFVRGELDQDELAGLPFEEARARLTAIKGVGNWTANYALMRCLRRPEAFPREDVGIHNALRARLSMERKPTLAEVDAIFEKYRGHEAYASLYLWMSLGES